MLAVASCGADDEVAEVSDAGSTQPANEPAADEPSSDEGQSDDVASDEPAAADDGGPDLTSVLFPDVVKAVATLDGDGTWTFATTLSSPYDSAERYADAWRVVGEDGEVYGTRILTHDHAAEQPFTRSHSGIEIPDDVTVVVVEGRDQISGWGGATVEVALSR